MTGAAFFLEIILLLDEEEFLLYRTKFFQFIVQSRVEKGNCIMIALQTEKNWSYIAEIPLHLTTELSQERKQPLS